MPEDFESLSDDQLDGLFRAFDEDCSGALSFDEFVAGMIRVRALRAEAAEEDAADQEDALDDAYMDAAEAFEDMDFGYTGELTIGAFMEALSDPVMVMKVSRASVLPTEWFTSMSEIEMAEWFMKIDK